MRTVDQMVQQEILCCMSSLVSTLAGGYGSALGGDGRGNGRLRDLESLCEQAGELASPIPDYEEAALQAGWTQKSGSPYWWSPRPNETGDYLLSAEQVCERHNIEPYDREVFEHWAVTDWFADRLIEQGEKVDKDFGNLCIWARTTTGQGIASDGVVERIYAKMMAPADATA